MKRLRKAAVLLSGVVALALTQACTPEELAAVEQATGVDLGTVEEVSAGCTSTFGAGSETVGGACWQVGADLIEFTNNQESSDSSGDGSYQTFPDCHSAVDYLFAGRWDESRAHMVVQRESTNKPGAVSPTGAKGCTQITSGIIKRFLGGSWSDPYWNVLAMRRTVDHPDWGWCHWDLVNFCSRGGEF